MAKSGNPEALVASGVAESRYAKLAEDAGLP